MAKHFALIRRSDFTDLFKYGTIFLNHMTIVAADDGSRTTTNDDELFKNANLFESSFTYLIIEFDQTGFTLDYPVLDIESVLNVYPLDDEAKRELEISFDERIRLSAPKWAKTYSLIQKIQTKKECEKGARNVFRIFQLGEKEWQAARMSAPVANFPFGYTCFATNVMLFIRRKPSGFSWTPCMSSVIT